MERGAVLSEQNVKSLKHPQSPRSKPLSGSNGKCSILHPDNQKGHGSAHEWPKLRNTPLPYSVRVAPDWTLPCIPAWIHATQRAVIKQLPRTSNTGETSLRTRMDRRTHVDPRHNWAILLAKSCGVARHAKLASGTCKGPAQDALTRSHANIQMTRRAAE